jgi:hypothetical protein
VMESTAQLLEAGVAGVGGRPRSYFWPRHTPIARRGVAGGILPVPSAC